MHGKFSVGLLLEAGADINLADNDGATPLSKAANNGHTDIVRLLNEEISLQKVLRASLYDMRVNDEEIYKRLKRLHTLNIGSTENSDHQLLFHMAKRGAIKAFNFLVERSVIPDDEINRCDQKGHTALYHAVKEGQVKMVKHILDKYRPNLTLKDNDYETLLKLAGAVIQLELSRYKVNNNNPTLLARALLLFSTGVGKKDNNNPLNYK